MSLNYLPKLELRIYFLCHLAFVLYSIRNVYSFRKEIHRRSSVDDLFQPGWFGLLKESGDSEWESFKGFVVKGLPWMAFHVVLSNFLRIFGFRQLLPWGFALIGIGFLAMENGFIPMLLLLLNAIPYFLIPKRWGGKGVLAVAMLSLLIANLSKSDVVYFWIMDNTTITHAKLFQLVVIDGWMTLKCISFTLDRLEAGNGDKFRFSHFLGYVFYFPTIYLGPPIIYSRFKLSYEGVESHKMKVMKTFLRDILKILLWYLALELSHHFLYLTSLQYAADILKRFNMLALFGYGYLMGQHFHVKYVVFYGFSCAFAKLDGIDTPPPPICVARVHKYSDMWKHFDRGLYEFLVKYIYARFQSRSSGNFRKIFAVFLTFAFIYVWHGYFLAILAWSALNGLGILLERGVIILQRSRAYQSWIARRLSSNNLNRLDGVIGTHLLILAVIANFFFLANYNVGVLFLKRTYASGVISYLGLSTSLLFIYFTSEYCKRRFNKK